MKMNCFLISIPIKNILAFYDNKRALNEDVTNADFFMIIL